MEAYKVDVTLTVHAANSGETVEIAEGVASEALSHPSIYAFTLGDPEIDDEEREEWRCPLCGEVRVGDLDIEDWGKCSICRKEDQ